MRDIKTQLIIANFIILSIINTIASKAQNVQTDTIKLMTYNVGNFCKAQTSGCTLLNHNLKSKYFRTILKYEKPDIIGMVKMYGNQKFCTDTVVDNVLDSICNGCWDHGTFSQASTYSMVAMLYFNNKKFGFAGSTVIYSANPNISDITLHKLYYKSQNLSTTHDTIFLKIVLAHLSPGSSSSAARETEVAGAMSWLNTHISSNENLIFMGDFNVTSSTEGCFQDLINSSNNNTKFYDPPNQLGQWSGSPANFALYLSQSTRTSDPGDCNPTGGLNNRFDHILTTSSIMNGADSIKYIQGSYKVVGQDGKHTGKALIDAPVNTSIPGSVDSALYYMSEHLPVSLLMKVSYPTPTGIENDTKQKIKINYTPIVTTNLIIQPIADNSLINNYTICNIIIHDMQGRTISTTSINPNHTNTIDVSKISNGMYLLEVQIEKEIIVKKFIKQ